MLKTGATNISAICKIDGVDVAYFTASYSSQNSYTITKNVTDYAKYAENQTECDSDYAEFEEKVKTILAQKAEDDNA